MNLVDFDEQFKHLKGSEKIDVNFLCDHPNHEQLEKEIGKTAARRNILKSGGKEFICRKCYMKYNNPMNQEGPSRQTDEEINVICPHPEHEGDVVRKLKKKCYYGSMEEPYLQYCNRCSQLGKEISEETKEKIRKSLKGRDLSEEHRLNIARWWAEHPEDVRKLNLKRGKYNPNEDKDGDK